MTDLADLCHRLHQGALIAEGRGQSTLAQALRAVAEVLEKEAAGLFRQLCMEAMAESPTISSQLVAEAKVLAFQRDR